MVLSKVLISMNSEGIVACLAVKIIQTDWKERNSTWKADRTMGMGWLDTSACATEVAYITIECIAAVTNLQSHDFSLDFSLGLQLLHHLYHLLLESLGS